MHNFMEPNEITSEVKNIVEQIIQKYHPLKIILFGSAGRGEYDKVNDLDFLIMHTWGTLWKTFSSDVRPASPQRRPSTAGSSLPQWNRVNIPRGRWGRQRMREEFSI
jgi:hypothetical protein